MYPRFRRSRDHKTARRTSGDLTLNSTTWADLDNGLDLVLAAREGDSIEVGISAQAAEEALDGYLDVATVVAGSPVNYFGTAGGASDRGIAAWILAVSAVSSPAGAIHRTLTAGDIDGGTVRLRLRYRTSSASNKTLRASSAIVPLQWYAKNLGPPDPS